MIIDAHLHVWRPTPILPHPETVVSPYCDIPIELFQEYMAEHGIDRAVLVQPIYAGEDNSYVANCAAARPERFAAVCVVDPRVPGAPDRLTYWVQQHGCKGLRLRPRNPDEAILFGNPATYPLWERARELGIAINLLMKPKNLPAVTSLAERFASDATSGLPIIIDHMGSPDVQAGVNSAEFQTLLHLKRFPQVYVKVSGYYGYAQQPYPYPDCWDLFRALYDHFGPARLIWGSDFPHILLKTSYRRVLLLQERFYTYLTSQDLNLIMGENAARLYFASSLASAGSR
ncbi:MAG: amidohydrolase [Chloroflexi bacterium]|nr:amidohydrolase [Chloroflexota bacterium]